MPFEVVQYPKPAVDFDDVTATANISASTAFPGSRLTFNKTQTTNIRTRTGKKARLLFIGNAVDPGGETLLTFYIYVNGAPIANPLYFGFQQALGATYDSMAQLTAPVELPQNAMIECFVVNASGTTAYNAFLRMRIAYEDQ